MKTRILSGIVLVIIMASALVCGSWYLFGLNLMIALIGMFELYRVIHMEKTVMAYAGYIACILYYICIGAGRDEYLLLVLAAAVMAVMAVYVFAFPKYRTENVCITLLGLVYVAMLLSYIYKVRTYHDGIYTVWLIFAASWVNDTFAYFTGVFFGRHKMAPKLSPKKSVEGCSISGDWRYLRLSCKSAYVRCDCLPGCNICGSKLYRRIFCDCRRFGGIGD